MPPRDAPITDAQRKRMFTVARSNGWTEAQVKVFLIARGIGTTSEIRRGAEYDAIIEALQMPPAEQTEPTARENPARANTG